MSDIRINALATTATSSASDDYVAIDGSANGTRKLNAYSPTFGGNLTVSGTGTSSVAGSLGVGTTSPTGKLEVGGSGGSVAFRISRDASNVLDVYQGGGISYIDASAASAQIAFLTTGSEKMRLFNNGNLFVGASPTDGGAKLQVNGTAAIAGQVSSTSGTTQLNIGVVGGGMPYVQGYDSASSSTTGIAFYTNAEQMRLFANGNLFVGASPVDGGQKLQVSGTAAISSTLNVTGNTSAGSGSGFLSNLYYSSGWKYVGSGLGAGFYADSFLARFLVAPNNTGGANAAATPVEFLQVSGTGDATFAGTVKPQLAATASAPTYVKGAIYFDTTLNKLRVGGATGWETITSV